MEESSSSTILEGKVKRVTFSLATRQEICKASISDCPISHASQLCNPFLGLPLEVGKCESCGTGEPGQCEGHFGYIELPTLIYHPNHLSELKKMLGLLCLKCLKLKNRKARSAGIMERITTCCEEASQISINERTSTDGASYLELKIPSKSRPREGLWTFLEKYGFRYGNTYSRPLLPSEVMSILRKLPEATRKLLRDKNFNFQDGYIIQYLPVPPNCLSVPDISDGINTMSTDYSVTLLKKVLRQVEIIKNSRSGKPNFESQEIEANDLQAAVKQYFEFRGTGKASRDVDSRFGVKKEENVSSTKAWLEKMKTLFIRKGSGFSSRSVITGDPFKGVSEIGLPYEIAQKITFEERVSQHNMQFLQKLVDEKLCLTYRDGSSTYSLKEGSKGHTFLRPGQVVHRRIMDGDTVFINRPPTTHKHSLQALSVYVHDDHTVKINPLICGPLSADFDGDCIHLFYPQSLEAKAEVVELFSVEKQLLSSHTGNFNLQLTNDSLLSLKIMFEKSTMNRVKGKQLAMFVPVELLKTDMLKSNSGPPWTASQILQATLPPSFDCSGERHAITKSEISKLDFEWDVMTSIVNDIITSMFFLKGPKEVMNFFNFVQPLLMENLFSVGFSVSLRDFSIPGDLLASIRSGIKRGTTSENYLHTVKVPVTNFIKASALGHLIDSKSESALNKVVQQIGFMGMQITDKGKFYSRELVKEMQSLYHKKYPANHDYPVEEFGMVSAPLFRGLDPYQEMAHSISSREVIVRSSRGLTEPGTLFKNLMAILRDVVICHDGTVRNMCSNTVLQFEYGVHNLNAPNEFCAGEPVGVLAATAMSNPAYKAVLDSSPSSNNSWEMMKEILLCGANFKNDISDRRVVLYLKNCYCGRQHCQEKAASMVRNQLKKISLKDAAIDFLIEYRPQVHESSDIFEGLVGHIHLDEKELRGSNINLLDILAKCQDTIILHQKKKKVGNLFKRVDLSISNCCPFPKFSKSESENFPCIQFVWQGTTDDRLDRTSHFLADTVCPALLQTVIKGDPRVSTANVIWVSPDTATWARSPCTNPKGELALDVTLEKEAVRKSGDAWRIVMDSCLSIIHLIDTQRSIPYAIKQVQDLLGISCAFEQAVQRLSTSVTMVTKGVLKEHLLLLGNSMTCAGTLIGFNAGGIKALSKLLNVQVPFMDATLFTPRKCFERAAQKCHTDNLSSVVASCAWGKHVCVGTGSPFEILWDTRKAELNPQNEIDVYSFLHLVSGGSNLGDMGTGCLGEESYLDQEDEFFGMDMSPERESGQDKPIFEDGDEFTFKSTDKDDFALEVSKESSWSSWGKKVDSETNNWAKTTENSNWGKKVGTGGNDWAKTTENSNWGKKVETAGNDWSNPKGPEESAWGKKAVTKGNDWSNETGKKVDTGGNDWAKTTGNSNWGKKVETARNDWSNPKEPEESAWGKKAVTKGNDWSNETGKSSLGASAQKSSSQQDAQSKDSLSPTTWGEDVQNNSTWGKIGDSEESSWGQKAKDNSNNSWGQGSKDKEEPNSWGSKEPSRETDSWGAKSVLPEQDQADTSNGGGHNSWEAKAAPPSSTWGSSSDWGKVRSVSPTGEKKEAWNCSSPKQTNDSSAWGSKKVDTPSTWGSLDDQGKVHSVSPSGEKKETWNSSSPKKTNDSTAWGSKKIDTSSTWGSSSEWGKVRSVSPTGGGEQKDSWTLSPKQTNDSTPWGSIKADTNGETGHSGWGRGRVGRGRGRGRGGRGRENFRDRGPMKDGDWKSERSPRPVGDSAAPSNLTMTRQRLDQFTAELQDVLMETESIMKNVRRIMALKEYTDGDRLPEEDQKYIIENIFNYHPDKAQKMGGGLDYIMVNKHKEFQESRCFYAVSVNGNKEDFSYLKCLQNFVKEKYPEKADEFIPKYFMKRQPRPGWNNKEQQQRGGPGGGGTPRWNSDTPSQDMGDEAAGGTGTGTPQWNSGGGWNSGGTTPTTQQDDASNSGWN